MKKTDVEEDAMKEILKNCNLYERIMVKMHVKMCVKIFKIGITFGYNNK